MTGSTPTAEGYLAEIQDQMQCHWKLVQDSIKRTQEKQKIQHDKKANPVPCQAGDIIYLFIPAKLTGKACKLERPLPSREC